MWGGGLDFSIGRKSESARVGVWDGKKGAGDVRVGKRVRRDLFMLQRDGK